MTLHEKLMKAIRDRKSQERFGYGILAADRHVQNVIDAIGIDRCYRHACGNGTSFGDAIEKAKGTLSYSNEDTVVDGSTRLQAVKTIEVNGDRFELPKNHLMTFQHILTTPRKDRDGDVLRTQGADVDPQMLLLWQHVHTLPIGKMIAVKEHSADRLSLVTSIVDMNQLSHDAAVMIDNGMGRFSHGFRAIEWEDLKEDPGGGTTGPLGFDIKRFEIMEASLVSVPSNRDAEVEEVMMGLISSGKLTSPIMKDYGKSLKDLKPVVSAVQYRETIGNYSREIGATDAASFKEVFDHTGKGNLNGDNHNGTKKEGTAAGASAKEGKDAGEKNGEGQAGNPEGVKRPALEGSWEWTEKQLRAQVERFLELSGAVSMRSRMGWIAGTYSDHAIVCAEHFEPGIEDEFLYFRVEWGMEESEPRFKGVPQPVEIVTTVEIVERSPLLDAKTPVTYLSTPASQESSWDATAAVGRLRAWAGVDAENPPAAAWAKYRRGFARVVGEKTRLESYKFPHHDVVDGKLVVVRSALAAGTKDINDSSTGWTSSNERQSVFSHLARHYEVFDEEAPELKDADIGSSRLSVVLGERAKSALEDVVDDLKEIASGRLTERANTALGSATLDKLTAIKATYCGDGEPDSPEIDAAKAMGIFLAQAKADERAKLFAILSVMQNNDATEKIAAELGCLAAV